MVVSRRKAMTRVLLFGAGLACKIGKAASASTRQGAVASFVGDYSIDQLRDLSVGLTMHLSKHTKFGLMTLDDIFANIDVMKKRDQHWGMDMAWASAAATPLIAELDWINSYLSSNSDAISRLFSVGSEETDIMHSGEMRTRVAGLASASAATLWATNRDLALTHTSLIPLLPITLTSARDSTITAVDQQNTATILNCFILHRAANPSAYSQTDKTFADRILQAPTTDFRDPLKCRSSGGGA